MKRTFTWGLVVTGVLTLGACKGGEQAKGTAATKQPAAAASQPAQPTPAVPTSTKTQGALDRGTTPEARDQIDADGVLRRGKALSANKALTVSEALASADKLAGQAVKLTGKVAKVCESMGCWFVVKGDKPEDTVKITAKDHGFFIPMSAVGRIATLEGQLSVGAAGEEEDCSGPGHKDEKKDAKPAREVAIEAAGVEMVAGQG